MYSTFSRRRNNDAARVARSKDSHPSRRRRKRLPCSELLEPRKVLAAGPLISEFVAINDSTLADGDGVYSDWIEIHNPTSTSLSLGGWHLTDDRDDLERWPLPNINLDGGEYVVIFASGQDIDDYIDSKGNYHTNFRLDGGGGDLLLVEPDGVTYESTFLDYPEQSSDISYGISIEGVSETLIESAGPLSYRVPTANDHPTTWTGVDFNDQQFIKEQTVAGAGLLITEINTGEDSRSIEIQNVSSAAIRTQGWTVAVNDAAAGPSSAAITVWNLADFVGAGEILYRTDEAGDEYWGAPIPWQLEGPGWAIILDDSGEVQDAVIWGYSAAQIATMRVDVGPFTNLVLADHWQGDGAAVGKKDGFATEPIEVGPGANMEEASGVDSAGTRLNVEPESVQKLQAGTYDVQNIAFASNSNGRGQLRAFLAVLTGGTNYETIWVSPATTPRSGDTIHDVAYLPGAQQFTLDRATDVYAGAWHDGDAKVRFSRTATVTNHDNSPTTPTAAGQTISGFSHGSLSDRTYAYHVTVGTGGSSSTSLSRVGSTDHDTNQNFVRGDTSSIGSQNSDSAALFGGLVPTIAGVGFGSGNLLLEDLIQTDVGASMLGNNASLWTRFEFNTTDLRNFDELILRVRYDDGFQAYLDGVPLVSRNAPPNLSFDSTATAERGLLDALLFEEIDVTDALSQLVAGDHVLAVHLLNASVNDTDLLLQPELLAAGERTAQFFEDATPGRASVGDGFNTVADTKFSVGRGFYETAFDVEISTATNGATIIYTLDGTAPEVAANGNIRNGSEYVAPINIGSTTTLRALAFKQGLRSSNVDTQTYLFLSDIVQQTRQSTISAGFPSNWGGRGSDYGLDPDVVGPNDDYNGVYAASIAEDLKSIPTLSLVLDIDDMFGSRGIYANSGSRGLAWEREVSAELIYPDGSEGFQVDAGIRVHGGASRGMARKNNLRLLFKEQYGTTKLDYPWFGEGVDRFDTVVLRSHFNDGWGWSGAGGDPLFSRDAWHRKTQAAMGHTASRSTSVHLYINGVYWGLYDPTERPDASFNAQHSGGDKTEWDVMNHRGVADGRSASWSTMRSLVRAVDNASSASAKWAAYQKLQGNDSDGNNDPSRENYLDVVNYIDYMLLSFYSGNDDWPNNNWYAARRRGPESEGFQFFAWDSEISMDLSDRTHLRENVVRDTNNASNGAAEPYGFLRRYDEFQLAFADRVHRHFFNGGLFYVDPANPSWDPLHPERNVPASRFVEVSNVVSRAIVPESARWGDQHRSRPYTRNAEWQSELDNMLRVFFPQRTGIVMGQLRSYDLYPNTDAPEFEVDGVRQHGGAVPAGAQLGFTNPNGGQGTVWFTTDGSDPRLPGGAVNTTSATRFAGAFQLSSPGTLKARIQNGNEWSALTEAFFAFDQSGVRVSEVHFNPADPSQAELAINPDFDNDDFEFVELVNVGSTTAQLDGIRLVDGIQFDFANVAANQIGPDERVVLVRNLEAFSTRYNGILDSITIAGQYDASLSNGGESVQAISALGEQLFEFEYSDNWFDHTDGGGYSLTVRTPGGDNADLNQATAWRPSNLVGGSPGSTDAAVDPDSLAINELLATSDGTGWIELQNLTSASIDVSNWYLSDSSDDLQKYQFDTGTVIPGNGYLIVNEATQFGHPSAQTPFALGSSGGRIYLTGGNSNGQLLGYREDQRYTAAEAGTALGRYTKSTGATDFVRLQTETSGAANSQPIVGPIVINEIMYHPEEGSVEFIELWNTSDVSVTLGDAQGRSWRMRSAIDIDMPADAAIPADGFALLIQRSENGNPAIEEAAFRLRNNVDASVPIWMYSPTPHGSLDNDGEKIFLEKPVENMPSDVYAIIDSVKYNDRSPWPIEADGGGSSLSRISGAAYGNDVANWGVSTRTGTPGSDNAYQDTTPPTRPSELVGRIEDEDTVSLAWSAASDTQSGIDLYRIYRDGQVIGTSVVTRFTGELEFASDQPNQYRVAAVNGDGIEGATTVEFVDFSVKSADFQSGADGYRGARDAEIREADPDSNSGLTDTELEVDGEDRGSELAILMRWDDLSIPENAIVVGASISLNVTNPGDEYSINRVRKDWSESQVTWNDASANRPWQVAGARGSSDRGPQVATLSGGIGMADIELNAAGLEMVQSWLSNPADTNFGIVISNPGQSTDGVDLYSREHSTVNQRPKLSILYSPVPMPSKLGDFNLDDVVDNSDITMLLTAILAGSMDPAFNVDGNGDLDNQDYDHLIRNILQVPYGDANLDRQFDSADLVTVFQAGEYEDGIMVNSTWASGDWNGDRDFDSSDLVKAFQEGAYEQPAGFIAATVGQSSTAIPDAGRPTNAGRFENVIDQLAAAVANRSDQSASTLNDEQLRDEAVRQLQQQSSDPHAYAFDDVALIDSLFRETGQSNERVLEPSSSSRLFALSLDSDPTDRSESTKKRI